MSTDTPSPRFQFSILSMLVLTAVVACLLTALSLLPPTYRGPLAVPLGVLVVLGFIYRRRIVWSPIIGFVVILLPSPWSLATNHLTNQHVVLAMLLFGAHGAAAAASLHALYLAQPSPLLVWLAAVLFSLNAANVIHLIATG